jgi:hypothetical protein
MLAGHIAGLRPSLVLPQTPMIRSSVNRIRFIRPSLLIGSDNNPFWRKFSVAGHL